VWGLVGAIVVLLAVMGTDVRRVSAESKPAVASPPTLQACKAVGRAIVLTEAKPLVSAMAVVLVKYSDEFPRALYLKFPLQATTTPTAADAAQARVGLRGYLGYCKSKYPAKRWSSFAPKSVPPLVVTTTTPPAADAEVTTSAGWRYRVTVHWDDAAPIASPLGCYAAPPPAQTNLRFEVTVTNELADRAAPFPEIVARANLTHDGVAVDPALTNLDTNASFFSNIELSPQTQTTSCFDASSITSRGQSNIGPGASQTITGVLGGIADPIPPGLTLFVRIFGTSPNEHHDITAAYP
jgi:hypothetical protein